MSHKPADEKLAMLEGELDNLRAKVAFLEGLLKEKESQREIPADKAFEVLEVFK